MLSTPALAAEAAEGVWGLSEAPHCQPVRKGCFLFLVLWGFLLGKGEGGILLAFASCVKLCPWPVVLSVVACLSV